MIFPTEFGDLTVLEPSGERFDALRALLPMGAVRLPPNPENFKYGIVMQCGNKEVHAAKQQIIDLPKGLADQERHMLGVFTCAAVGPYLRHGFSGVLMPLSYTIKKRTNYEVGIAFFGVPAPHGAEATDGTGDAVWDSRFGVGFSRMMTAFMDAFDGAQDATGQSLHPRLGLDYQPRLALGTLHMGLAIHGSDVFMLNKDVSLCEQPFTIFRSAGITQVYHLPSVPLALAEGDAGLGRRGGQRE